MNLGQMLMVIGAIVLLGMLVLNANSTIYQANDIMYTSEFGVTAISLSTSIVEEAMGKMFDKVVADSNSAALLDSTLLTPPGSLGPEAVRRILAPLIEQGLVGRIGERRGTRYLRTGGEGNADPPDPTPSR